MKIYKFKTSLLILASLVLTLNANAQDHLQNGAQLNKLAQNHDFIPQKASAPTDCLKALEGDITPEFVAEMQATYQQLSPRLRAALKTMLVRPIKQMFINQDLIANHDASFTNEINCGPAPDQHGIGTCWNVGTQNLLRIELPNKMLLSPAYMEFFHFLEQENQHLNDVIDSKVTKLLRTKRDFLKTEISQGGYFQYAADLIKKYGVVPKAVMPDTYAIYDPSLMMKDLTEDSAYSTKLLVEAAARKASPEELQKIKKDSLARFWRILTVHFGAPPQEFQIPEAALVEQPPAPPVVAPAPLTIARPIAITSVVPQAVKAEEPKAKTPAPKVDPGPMAKFTPKEFAAKFTTFNDNDYITVGSYPQLEENKFYRFKKNQAGNNDGSSYMDLTVLNLSAARMAELVKESILSGNPVPFAADVSVDVDAASGIMHPDLYQHQVAYGVKPADWNARLNRYETNFFELSVANHEMMITGFDQPAGSAEPIKYKVENSWGSKSVGVTKDKNGKSSPGYMSLYKEWLPNVYEIAIKKSLLTAEELKLLTSPHRINAGTSY